MHLNRRRFHSFSGPHIGPGDSQQTAQLRALTEAAQLGALTETAQYGALTETAQLAASTETAQLC